MAEKVFIMSLLCFTSLLGKKLLELQILACKNANVKYQYFDSPGGTDAGAIHKNLDGILKHIKVF